MREILFRAKLKDWKTNPKHNRWIEGYYLKKEETTYCVKEDYERFPVKTQHYIAFETMTDWGLPNEFRLCEIDSNTICQLVQTDKIRVWENDIIRWEDEDIISVIRYDKESAKFIIDDYGIKGCLMEYGFDEDAGGFGKVDTSEFDDFYSFDGFEVIGNIFDNPELIKSEF